MKKYTQNGIKIIECSPNEFSIKLVNQKKKECNYSNYTNAGYFAKYQENNENFTLPVGHLICDFNSKSEIVKHYCTERGHFINNKFIFDSSKWSYSNSFYNKSITTFYINNNIPYIEDCTSVNDKWSYAITGVPVMKNGQDVKYYGYVNQQGWDSSCLYATYHIFLGLKENNNNIFIMGWKTSTSNLIYSAEAYNKFKQLGFFNVIKLDGGGSYYMQYENNKLDSTSENRLINNIIVITPIIDNTTDEVSNEPSEWAKLSWEEACEKGVFDKTNPKGNLSREQLATVLDCLNLLN